ncbi:MAG: MFS transporter [Rhodobacteraceae bacterium]|nr:MFS transporter [Paracoccaceae bacterium]
MPGDWRLDRPLLVACIVFLSVGLMQGSIGPALHDIARQAGTTAVAASAMMTTLFVSALAAQTLAALTSRRLGHRTIMLAGMAAFIGGVAGIAASGSLAMLLLAAAFLGAGNGSLLLTGNVVAAEASARAGPLNLVNAMFGVGAILAPVLVSLSMRQTGMGSHAVWAAPAAMGVALVLLLASPAAPRGTGPAGARPPAAAAGAWRAVLRSPLVWLLGAFLLVEVSVEIAVATWLPTILQKAVAIPLATGALFLSLFWLLLTLSRFAAAWASRFLTNPAILAAASLGAVAGAALLLSGVILGGTAVTLAGVALLGSALGPIFPSALSVLRAAFPRDAGFATGVVFGASNIAGAAMPVAFGALVTGAGPKTGVAALLALTVVMGLVLVAVLGAARRSDTALQAAPRAGPAAGAVAEDAVSLRP